MADQMSPELARVMAEVDAAGIDYGREARRAPYGGQVGATAGSTAEWSPLADLMRRAGVQGAPGPWQDLRRFAPAVEQAERGLGAVPGMVGEMTGIPAAGRAGEALAAGDLTRGAGEALQALPSRLTQFPGLLLSQAEAQQPDPRQLRIQKLDRDIAGHRKTLQDLGQQNFKSKAARENASKPYLDAIGSAQAERDRLQGALDSEFQTARDAELANERSAAWRNTSTNRAVPAVGYGTTGLGFGLASYLPYRAARGPTLHYNRTMADLDTRWRTAIDRANDMSLTLPQRRQAAQEAIGIRNQFRGTQAPEGLTWGDRARTAVTSGLTADAGIMAPDLFDYIYSMQDPTGPLHESSAAQLNPANNPGRVTAGFLGGAGFGGVAEELGTRFPRVQTPTGYDAETDALLKRYKSLAPPKRGRR